MIDIERYLEGGKVKRYKIIADIKARRIGRDIIKELDKDSRISEAYFGMGKFKKINKKYWNNRYLDELSLVSVAEEFNKEYLLYFNEVANYIYKKRIKKEKSGKIFIKK